MNGYKLHKQNEDEHFVGTVEGRGKSYVVKYEPKDDTTHFCSGDNPVGCTELFAYNGKVYSGDVRALIVGFEIGHGNGFITAFNMLCTEVGNIRDAVSRVMDNAERANQPFSFANYRGSLRDVIG